MDKTLNVINHEVDIKMGRMRWKREKVETGLRSVGAGPRGSKYWDGCQVFARTAPSGGNWRGPLEGWYFYGSGANTCRELVETEEEAKAQAVAYISNL